MSSSEREIGQARTGAQFWLSARIGASAVAGDYFWIASIHKAQIRVHCGTSPWRTSPATAVTRDGAFAAGAVASPPSNNRDGDGRRAVVQIVHVPHLEAPWVGSLQSVQRRAARRSQDGSRIGKPSSLVIKRWRYPPITSRLQFGNSPTWMILTMAFKHSFCALAMNSGSLSLSVRLPVCTALDLRS